MKLNYIPLGMLLWLAACSSPAAQNKPQQSAAKNDSAVTEAKDTTKGFVYTPVIFLDSNVTVPPYGIDTIKALVAKLENIDDPDDAQNSTEALDEKTYASLSFNEKFTYHMVHPERYSQNCDVLPMHADAANRIHGTLAQLFMEYYWSERQLNFFKNNRDSVNSLIRSLSEKNNRIGDNFKEAIVEMNSTELIPYLINFYNREKNDRYILTVLLLLMKNNKYPEFVNSSGYKKLYEEKEIIDYNNAPHLVYNKANEDLIIQRATNFYNGLQVK